MKKTIVAAALFTMATSAFAAQGDNIGSGRVTFNGEVKAASCSIDVNNSGSNDATVTLPLINANEFVANGAIYKKTPFNISLSNCVGATQEGANTLGIAWTEAQLSDDTTGYLANLATADAAKGVSLALANRGGDVIVPGSSEKAITKQSEVKDGKTVFNYEVGYVATDKSAVKAGKVTSQAVYSVFYQ